MNEILIMKFGGASVESAESFDRVADIILARKAHFQNIAIVVSAMGNTTDELLKLAYKVNADPPRRELDMLITVGERISIALLAMAIAKKGMVAKSFTGSQSGIVTSRVHSEARIVDVKPFRVHKAFSEGYIAIIAGFQGVSLDGEITTLGRGGSDTSAVALAAALKAPLVEFYKNVSGIFNKDPFKDAMAEKYSTMTYVDAYNIAANGAKVLHPRCILLAKKNGIRLHVKSFLSPEEAGTLILEQHSSDEFLKPCYECLENNESIINASSSRYVFDA